MNNDNDESIDFAVEILRMSRLMTKFMNIFFTYSVETIMFCKQISFCDKNYCYTTNILL